jgi:hypothetical protein
MALLNKLAGRIGYTGRTPSPLPEKIAVLLEESRWLILIVVASFLALSPSGATIPRRPRLVARRLHDDAAQPGRPQRRLAGRPDALRFRLSAWWWIVLLLVFVWWGYRRLTAATRDRRPLYIALAGFSGADRRQQRPGNPALLYRQGTAADRTRVASSASNWAPSRRPLSRLHGRDAGAVSPARARLEHLLRDVLAERCRTYRCPVRRRRRWPCASSSSAGRTAASAVKSRASAKRWSRSRRSASKRRSRS